ncbi:Anti-sigma regulatory factor (Ser/Thr protein kinase) [Maridesulfovibrio ferrireducens]|uniref:Anti-sigma regulatory factor (Ser/Thr protein kinase) n=1 Tax=Maridesulfovibrio ferrireducens TaxID=246191 RepID=A0A1G9JRL7_9BACT|nr:GNAT family N-acetyltransferase [Maridesulfovibrio ferrireducens]SDL40240.1 Anti-sigma regulatory factor (Ser/Thr protein kinase) [Maridesulfovibrio ferrireducens]
MNCNNILLSEPVQVCFTASVEIPYDLRFMVPVLDWASTLVSTSGGNQRESDGLRLALEETLVFLISAYPDAQDKEVLRVNFQLKIDGIATVTIANAGPPIHLNRIPNYDPQNPEESELDGLWFHLAQNAVDHLEFNNLGLDGWQIVASMRLACPSFEKGSAEEDLNDKKINFNLRRATPDDAAQLVDLTYDTYGYEYTGEFFYYESQLRKVIEDGDVKVIVAENGETLAGSVAFFLFPQKPHLAETGSLMVRHSYRCTRAISYLMKESVRYIDENSLGVDIYSSTCVTTSVISQKIASHLKYYPFSLLLNMGCQRQDAGKYSWMTLFAHAKFIAPVANMRIHLPEQHHEIVGALFDQADISHELIDEVSKDLPKETTFYLYEIATLKAVSITFQQLGQDWIAKLRKTIFNLRCNGNRAFTIYFPAWNPIPPNLDEEMLKFNGIFVGVSPISADECCLVYSILVDGVDFDNIQLVGSRGQELKEHIRGLYNKYIKE